MKFLIPNHASADSFVDNVATSLRDMGHDVVTLPPITNRWAHSPYRRILRSIPERAVKGYRVTEERWALRTARAQRPDVVLALTQPLSEPTLFELKKIGVPHLVAWWGDAPANMAGMGLLSAGWDAIYLKDRQAVEKFRRAGFNASLLHEAMNPRWHKPVATEQSTHVAIAGNFYGYRQALTVRLIQAGINVALYGARIPHWSHPSIAARHTGRYVVREEKSRVFGEAMACLNSTALSEGNSLNCRAFEIAGAEGLQIMEYRPAIDECFVPGEELLVFRTFEELLELISLVASDKTLARRIRAAGGRRARAHHTYAHRLNRIIDDLGNRN